MNEGFRNLALLVWALCAVNSNSYAQDSATVITEESSTSAPTIVYGAARRADGETDEVLIEQPAGASNPLGNPLPDAAEQQQPQAVTEPVSGGNADNAPAAAEPMQDVPNVQGQPGRFCAQAGTGVSKYADGGRRYGLRRSGLSDRRFEGNRKFQQSRDDLFAQR